MSTDYVETVRVEALKALQADDNGPALRSCWNCNLAHEHLRNAEYVINCFDCRRWFFRGVDILPRCRYHDLR